MEKLGDRISVVIPALNEARNLPFVLSALPAGMHEVIVVDGHSVDDTAAVASQVRPDAKVIQQTRWGKGNALACGFREVTGDVVVTLEADGSADPREIPAFVAALAAGADFAKGTRFDQGGISHASSRPRMIGYAILNRLISLFFGVRYTDLCYGYNAFRTTLIPKLALPPTDSFDDSTRRRPWGDGFEIEPLINVRAARIGARIIEVGSTEHNRIHGISNLDAFPEAIRVLRLIVSERWLDRPDGKGIFGRRGDAMRRNRLAKLGDSIPRRVTAIALKLAGCQRAYLWEAWSSDLLDHDGVPLPLSSRLRYAAGYLPAALRYRLDDLGGVLGRLLDGVLISRRRTWAAATALVAIPVEMIFSHEGLYGFVTRADQLAVIVAAMCASVRALRKLRCVTPPSKKRDRRPH